MSREWEEVPAQASGSVPLKFVLTPNEVDRICKAAGIAVMQQLDMSVDDRPWATYAQGVHHTTKMLLGRSDLTVQDLIQGLFRRG